MAQTDLSQLKHTLASQVHLYYETKDDGTNVLRHVRVHQRTYNVPADGITIDDLPDNVVGTEQIKDGTVQEQDLSQQLKAGLLSKSEKGANGGIATLDNEGKVPFSQLPEAVVADESSIRGIVNGYES